MLTSFSNNIGTFSNRITPVTSWWLSGGIDSSNCVAAYQAKGSESLVASYNNLANPGTYDIMPVIAPTWDATNGWKSSGTAYLDTSITNSVAGLWSCVIRLSNSAASCGAMGALSGSNFFFIRNAVFGIHTYYIRNAVNSPTGNVLSGVLAISGSNCFLNGVADGSVGAGTATISSSIYIFGCNYNGTPNYRAALYIQASAIYNTSITAAQVLAVTNAMNAL